MKSQIQFTRSYLIMELDYVEIKYCCLIA